MRVGAQRDAQSSGSVRIFNGSPAILIVDADGNGDYEDGFENGTTALGYLHDLYEAPSARARSSTP